MKRRNFLFAGALGLGSACLLAPCRAYAASSIRKPEGRSGQWGDLIVRFVLEGEPPKPRPINVTVDCDYCGVKSKLYEERLVVNPKDLGIAWVAGWLSTRPAGTLTMHSCYAKNEKGEVQLNSTNCRIDPHVQALRTTQTLLVRNTDPIRDGIKIDPFMNQPVNIMMGPKSELRLKFRMVEPMPAHVACPVHPWESGWLVIKDHPYVGIADPSGRMVIKNLPVGKWSFQFWHESCGFVAKVKLNGSPTLWLRGRLTVEVKPGINDLGEVHIGRKAFRV